MEKITSQRGLKQAIFAVKSNLSDTEIFLSNAYKTFCMTILEGITKRFDRSLSITITDDDENVTACTDGKNIQINQSCFFHKNKDRKGKNMLIIGALLHETGHVMFTDMKQFSKAKEHLAQNELWPMPDYSEERDITCTTLLSENLGSKLVNFYHNIGNIVEDGFIEPVMMELIPGYGQCLAYRRSIKKDSMQAYDTIKESDAPNSSKLISMCLQYALFKCIKGVTKDTPVDDDELLTSFERLKPFILEAVKEKNSLLRLKKQNALFCQLFCIIKDEIEQQKEQEEQGDGDDEKSQSGQQSKDNQQSQNNDGSQEQNQQSQQGTDQKENGKSDDTNSSDTSSSGQPQNSQGSQGSQFSQGLEKTLQNLQQQMQQQQMIDNVKRTNETSSVNTSSLESPSETPEDNSSQGDKTAESLLKKIENDVAESQVSREQEKAITDELNRELKEVSKHPTHKKINSQMERVKVTPSALRLYDELHGDLDSIARHLMKNLKKEIKDRQLGDRNNGLYMGRRMDTHSLYRQDKKVFTKNILPEDIPDMEISILIDMSYSMDGERIETARNTAYITYSFCRMLNIPISVYGHTTNGDSVRMFSFTDKNSIDNLDGKRIFDMDAHLSNRDGYALRFCLNQLEKSDAKTKIQMIVSDGRPNHSGYSGMIAKEDMQDAVAKARKNGILTIAAGIGEDSKTVKYYYSDGISEKKSAVFLDISDLKRLPKTFVQIIKKFLV